MMKRLKICARKLCFRTDLLVRWHHPFCSICCWDEEVTSRGEGLGSLADSAIWVFVYKTSCQWENKNANWWMFSKSQIIGEFYCAVVWSVEKNAWRISSKFQIPYPDPVCFSAFGKFSIDSCFALACWWCKRTLETFVTIYDKRTKVSFAFVLLCDLCHPILHRTMLSVNTIMCCYRPHLWR